MIEERFDVEWNAGAGWMTNPDHCFWNLQNACGCFHARQTAEGLRKWPMRLVRRDMVNQSQMVLAVYVPVGPLPELETILQVG